MQASERVSVRALCSRALARFHVGTLSLASEAADLLFPIACVGCGTYGASPSTPLGESRWLCEDCRARIVPGRLTCVVCGAGTPTGRTCYACLPKTPLAGVISVGPYHDPVLQAAIKRLKFAGIRALADPLGDLLARRIVAAGLLPSVLVPLPLHPRRERTRGYNQARLLANVVGQTLQSPVHDLLVRIHSSSPQTSIIESPRARRRNVAGAFAWRPAAASTHVDERASRQERNDISHADHARPGRVILVDDVLTTGATISEAAEVVRGAGLTEIWAGVVAHG